MIKYVSKFGFNTSYSSSISIMIHDILLCQLNWFLFPAKLEKLKFAEITYLDNQIHLLESRNEA